jgi:DNA-binding MarR family transcriptional regulator
VKPDTVDRMVQAWAEQQPELDTSPLEVVGRLLLCTHHLERAIRAALQPYSLTFSDFDVINTLRRLGDPVGTNPSVLAQSSLITTGAMTSRLDRLERAGLLYRKPDPADRRGVLVSLTRQGRRIAEKALTAVLAADQAFLEPLSGKQRGTVAAALKTILLRYEP